MPCAGAASRRRRRRRRRLRLSVGGWLAGCRSGCRMVKWQWRRRRRRPISGSVIRPFRIAIDGEGLFDSCNFGLFELIRGRDKGSATSECMDG